jgi:hypothetical protein
MGCWSEPTAKDAFILSWIGVVLEFAACVAGIAFYVVSKESGQELVKTW